MVENEMSPREFMRSRRPERFSDSINVDRPILDRSMLEYYLDTLSSRNQQTEFEKFARHIAEKEICPNLLPQTGPTGGGDSKVDSETYPVADSLSLGWYLGVGREAATERWGFAFSVKKEWRSKVRSDIKKIAETGRGYIKAFFVSNQFIPDRIRANIEDELRTAHSIDVRILDRSWILDKVFTNHHEELAINDLEIDVTINKTIIKGPLDTQREKELEDIEKRIELALQNERFGLSLVEDCIESAMLSRNLERPRAEIDGRLLRAENIAKKYGTSFHNLSCSYERAWTAYWWHEDYELFKQLYIVVEGLTKYSEKVHDLELLNNLWFLLYTSVSQGKIDPDSFDYQNHTNTLREALERITIKQDRPSAALHARSILVIQQLALTLRQDPEPVIKELIEMVEQSSGLIGFPLEALAEIIVELGDSIGDLPVFNELFEKVISVTSTRKGEVSAARMLLKRGLQQLNSERPYDAIICFGRALSRLYKHESKNDLIKALYLCSCAYEQVGLLWAARGTVLTAASIASFDLYQFSHVSILQARCHKLLKWQELQIGRLPHLLSWHELDLMVSQLLIDKGYDKEELTIGEKDFDGMVGGLILRADIRQLKQLTTLPDKLSSLNLHGASLALTYSLGHEDEIPEDFKDDEIVSMYHFFKKWRDHPSSKLLPPMPQLYEGQKVELISNLLGCRINIDCVNEHPCIELAESMLAALESLLSTSISKRVIAREPILTVNIRKANFGEQPFESEIRYIKGRPNVEIRCADFDPNSMPREFHNQLKDRLLDLLFDLLSRVFFVGDVEDFAKQLFRDELAIQRAIDFTSSFITLGNVLGDNSRTNIEEWKNDEGQDYALKRSEEWDLDDRVNKLKPSLERDQPKHSMGKGEPPDELIHPTKLKHTKIATVSLIHETLWDKATWCGTGFLWVPGDPSPPTFAPIFRDGNAAEQIFSLWREELGGRDTDERLRISVVCGISQENPFAYRVIIGSNPTSSIPGNDIEYVAMVCRLNTMEPSSNHNLNGFMSRYKACGGFILSYMIMPHGSEQAKPVFGNHILKRELHIREAWEIGRHDYDSVGVLEDDDPIIPGDQIDAPVIELLQWKRNRSQQE